jgi:hypothetical protein
LIGRSGEGFFTREGLEIEETGREGFGFEDVEV